MHHGTPRCGARALLADARGAHLVEYLVVLGLVALMGIGAFRAFGSYIRSTAEAQGRCVAELSDKCTSKGGAQPPPDRAAALGGAPAAPSPPPAPTSSPALPNAAAVAVVLATVAAVPGEQPPAQPPAPPPQPPKRWWNHGLDFGKGVVVDGAWGTVTGVYHMVRHPIDTATGIGYAVAHPIKTGTAIKDAIGDKWDKEPGAAIGAGVFEVVTLPIAAAKAGKAAQAAKLAKVAEEAAQAAKLAEAAKIAKIAEEAAKAAKIAEDAAKAAKLAEEAAKAAKAAEAAKAARAAKAAEEAAAVAKAGKAAALKLKEMNPHYVGEHLPGNSIWRGSQVKYLSEAERAAYKLTIKDGKIYDATGKLFDTSAAATAHSGAGRAIFVMDETGEIYASTVQKVGEFHHSSLAAGKPVAAAGELEVKNGVLSLISDKSGHYMPPREFTEQAIQTLEKKGIDVSTLRKDLHAPR